MRRTTVFVAIPLIALGVLLLLRYRSPDFDGAQNRVDLEIEADAVEVTVS